MSAGEQEQERREQERRKYRSCFFCVEDYWSGQSAKAIFDVLKRFCAMRVQEYTESIKSALIAVQERRELLECRVHPLRYRV